MRQVFVLLLCGKLGCGMLLLVFVFYAGNVTDNSLFCVYLLPELVLFVRRWLVDLD